MPTLGPSAPISTTISLDAGSVLTITPGTSSTASLQRSGDKPGDPNIGTPATIAGAAKYGPFPSHRYYTLQAVTGSVTYTVDKPTQLMATHLGNAEGFTGNRTLVADDNAKILRCDDSSNVTITVPNNLPEGFNVGLSMWGTGTVTISAGSGATNRTSKTALSTRYQSGGVLVLKNSGGAAAEFILGGDFA